MFKDTFIGEEISVLVLASSQEARIFAKIGDKNELNLLKEIKAELDTNHEKPGRTYNSSNPLRHAVEPHTDRREVERHHFAKKISETLTELEKAKPFDKLLLVASHKMLQEIGQSLDDHLSQKLIQKLAKDLSKFTNAEIQEYFKNKFGLDGRIR